MSFLEALQDFSVLTTYKNKSSIELIFNRINTLKKEKNILEKSLKNNQSDFNIRWKLNDLNNSLILDSSILLDIAKQTIMSFAKGYGKVLDGRVVSGRLKTRPIIIMSRNQALHYDEKNYDDKLIELFKKMYNKKLISNKDVSSKNFAFEIIDNVLKWNSYDDMYKDLVDINGNWNTKELFKRLLWLNLWHGNKNLLEFYKFPFFKNNKNNLNASEKKTIKELEEEFQGIKKFLRFPKWQQEAYREANRSKFVGRQKQVSLNDLPDLNSIVDSYCFHRIRLAIDKECKKECKNVSWRIFNPLTGIQTIEGKIISHRSKAEIVKGVKTIYFEYWFVDSSSLDLKLYLFKVDKKIEYNPLNTVKIRGELIPSCRTGFLPPHQVFRNYEIIE